MSMGYCIGIGLFGKGSTNHLHRPEILAAFLERGFQVTYIVREDYLGILSRLEGGSYLSCRVRDAKGWRLEILILCQKIRHMHPSWDRGNRQQFAGMIRSSLRPWNLARNLLCRFLARFRCCASLAAQVEAWLFSPGLVEGLDTFSCDLLLLLGIGTVNSEMEGAITLWAGRQGIPLVHCIGNYDHLTSKGFRGILPDRLLAWGPQMVDDAVTLHGIPKERVRVIGSLRYNSIRETGKMKDRESFLRGIGLDPALPTIVFAGFIFESQYFEMLEVHRHLREARRPCQLVLRLYPNKILMNSVYARPLAAYAGSLAGVYVSCADPHFKSGSRDCEVLQVEEEELWNILRHCDVLVDYYSTIVLEAAIFDKPVIHMHYLPSVARVVVREEVPLEYWNLIHNRRITSYGAVDIARSREELVALIEANLGHAFRRAAARKKMVERECGPLDGRACCRLIDECEHMMDRRSDLKCERKMGLGEES